MEHNIYRYVVVVSTSHCPGSTPQRNQKYSPLLPQNWCVQQWATGGIKRLCAGGIGWFLEKEGEYQGFEGRKFCCWLLQPNPGAWGKHVTGQFAWKWNVSRVNPRLWLNIELNAQLGHNRYDQLGGCKDKLPLWKAEFKF